MKLDYFPNNDGDYSLTLDRVFIGSVATENIAKLIKYRFNDTPSYTELEKDVRIDLIEIEKEYDDED